MYSTKWCERVNGTTYYINVFLNPVYHHVKIEDGSSTFADTIKHSIRPSFTRKSIEKQVSDALSSAVAKHEDRQEKVSEINDRMTQASRTVKDVYEE